MSGSSSPDCSRFVDDLGVFDILLPDSPLAGGMTEFEWESLNDVATFDDCIIPGTQSTTPTVAAQHSTIAKPQPAGDVFDALDTFLEAEFPMGEPRGQSPTESNCWTAAFGAAKAMPPVSTPTSPQPAQSASSSGTAAPSFSSSDVTAPLLRRPLDGLSNIPVSQSVFAQSADAVAAAVSAVKAASSMKPTEHNSSLPRWKIYHMQQRQELLASKQPGTTPASSASADSAASKTAQASTATPAAPAAVVSASTASATTAVIGVTLPVTRANSVTSNFTGSITVPPLHPATLTPEHVLLLNALQQQQQLQLLQQQHIMSSKRSLTAAKFGVPQAKRCRTAAAGSVAAPHLYGLEPVNQLQELQAMQMQARRLQTHQHQIEHYQQQQLQALHQQLHMRLQMQQHQEALQLLPITSCK